MKSFKYFQKPKSGDCYVNTLLALLIVVFGIVIMNACQHKETSWEMLRLKKTGSVLLAHIGSAESLYKDEHGNLHGNGVEIINDFIQHTQTKYDVSIKSEVQKFDSTEEVLKRIKTSNGGVFGWNIDAENIEGIQGINFSVDSVNKQKSRSKIVLKASSDWIPVLASFVAHRNTIRDHDRSPLNLESVQSQKSF